MMESLSEMKVKWKLVVESKDLVVSSLTSSSADAEGPQDVFYHS